MRAALGLLAALLGAPAAAASPCDALSDPLAFNACLARQGPAAGKSHVYTAPARRAALRIVAPRRHGRAEMVFSPGK